MNIAFTICSNNYLAYAKTVGDSFLQYHPDQKFVIGLVDKYMPGVDYSFLQAFDIIPVEALHIENFEALKNRYNITELNTVVKPAYFHYLFQQYKAGNIIYIDPDILVTGRFDEVINALQTNNIIITPHICSPVDDGFSPSDYETLRGGIFNLGFIALSNYEKVQSFLNWWDNRVVKYGLGDYTKNMFYDQIWINYVPCFYDNYQILKHPGYNMAHWNLHERTLIAVDNGWMVNGINPLRFFHFSGYNYKMPDVICKYAGRYDFASRTDLQQIFDIYNQLLHSNGIEAISKWPVFYYPQLHHKKKQKNTLFNRLKWRISRSFKILATGE